MIWKTLLFKALTQILLSKVNGQMDQLYSKKGGERVFDFFSTPKVVGHNRVPSKHSYY